MVVGVRALNLNILIAASIRKNDELNWVKVVIEKHHRDRIWLVVDKKSTEILARSNILSKVNENKMVVFAGKKPEELALRVFKVATPDIIYTCDKYGALKVLVDFLRITPVKQIEC
ncbi:MAG: hypothetical protein QXP03_03265 [Desulfurococcaceae archaeon]